MSKAVLVRVTEKQKEAIINLFTAMKDEAQGRLEKQSNQLKDALIAIQELGILQKVLDIGQVATCLVGFNLPNMTSVQLELAGKLVPDEDNIFIMGDAVAAHAEGE